MDSSSTNSIIEQLARSHPYLVLALMLLPGGATFLTALARLIEAVNRGIIILKGNKDGR